MDLKILGVLMWKHLMVRRKRFIQTPVEFLSPIAFFFIVYLMKDTMDPPPPEAARTHSKVRQTDIMELTESSYPSRIFYYPDNNLTSRIMEEVGKRAGRQKMDSITVHDKQYYQGITNLNDYTDYIAEFTNDEVLIMFKNMDTQDWPEKLKYSIRKKDAFFSDSFMPTDGALVPHARFGGMYEEFLALQWAIDTSFIYLLTGKNITQNIALQEFPYYGLDKSEQSVTVYEMFDVFGWMSLFLYFVFLMSRLLEERTSGIQELIKMVGVPLNTLGFSHFLNVLPVGLLFAPIATCFLKMGDEPMVEHSDGFLMAIILFLQFLSITAMAYTFSFVANSTQYSISIAVFVYIMLNIPSGLVFDRDMARGVRLVLGLLPNVPLDWYWMELRAVERSGRGIDWESMWESHSAHTGPVSLAALLLVLQSALFFALAAYLSYVCPGKYGQAQPWNFIFQKQFWSNNEIRPTLETDEQELMSDQQQKFFEPPPPQLTAGIRVQNVSKVFPKHKALSNVTLDVYKGEILILLGHNGAGKTTLISIITGMISPTEGKVLVGGVDVTRNRSVVRKTFGLCPQHNLFFSDLTVLEHVMFFTMIKTGSLKGARESSMELLQKLGIGSKAGLASRALSGGMKRRLQLGCALAGGAAVLVLDEPTSGLDVETRRQLWDLLLSLRGSRTVILSTHFMEEAEALADRAAALHSGRLRCHATTMHLKKAIGTGYRLSLSTAGLPREALITPVVTESVPDARLTQKSLNSLIYSLPANSSPKFSSLFTKLESKKTELGIENIGVGVSTLEEVFLKLCSDTDFKFGEDEVDSGRIEPTRPRVTGAKLYIRQVEVLLKRQLNFLLFKKIYFLLMQVIVPVIIIFCITLLMNNSGEPQSGDSVATDLNIYDSLPHKKALYSLNSPGADITPIAKTYPGVEFIKTDDVAKTILEIARKDLLQYNQYLVGIELNDTNAKVLYTTLYRHCAPAAMNVLTNVLGAQAARAAPRTFLTYNEPVRGGAAARQNKVVDAKEMSLGLLWAGFIIFVIMSSMISLTSLPCKERQSVTRHIHIMCGCPAELHFMTTLMFHVALTFVTLIVPTVIAVVCFDVDKTLTAISFLLVLMLVLVLSCMSFMAFAYLVSFRLGERGTGIILFASLVVFGLITPITQGVYSVDDNETGEVKSLLNLIEKVIPPHTMMVALVRCVLVARLNALCDLNKAMCPNIPITEPGFDSKRCCDGDDPTCYLCMEPVSPGPQIIALAVQPIVYMFLVVLTQRGVIARAWERLVNHGYSRRQPAHRDEMVRAEKLFVEKLALDSKQIRESNISLMLNDVHKRYRSMFKSCNAVKGISFSVKKGECFGLLGVNGAGKSTTFKMLTAEECPTRGDIYGNGFYLNKDSAQYLRTLGYCPQFFGLDAFQTGIDNIKLLLTLRGLDAADVDEQAEIWIDIVGLSNFAKHTVSSYSGGMWRRLGCAGAVCGGAPLAALDEPTAGVDVAARRRLWAALRQHLARGRTVLITSHSMDEMEALCDRIGIMSGGVVRALGGAAELRARHAAGHAVLLKLRHAALDEVDGSSADSLNSLKNALKQKFNCTLKDEHKTTLHYHINETLRYSELFTALEALKSQYPRLVEDYTVSETTLEEVFLAFAREHDDDGERNNMV